MPDVASASRCSHSHALHIAKSRRFWVIVPFISFHAFREYLRIICLKATNAQFRRLISAVMMTESRRRSQVLLSVPLPRYPLNFKSPSVV